MMRGDRLGLLQLTRVVMAAVAVGAVLSVESLSSGRWHAVPTLVAWVLITLVTDVGRRVAKLRGVGVPLALLVVDAIVLAFVIANTGGHRSPLLGLVYLHVVAVSLLVSPRVALRVSLLHGFLLFGGFVAARSESFGLRLDGHPGDAAAQAALHATGFLLVAVGVAACASLNDRVLRRSHRELGAIADAGAVLSGTLDVDVALELAAEALRRTITAGRVAVAVAESDGALGWRAAIADDSSTSFVSGTSALAVPTEPDLLHLMSRSPYEDLLPAATNVVAVPVRNGGVEGVLLVEIGGSARTQVPLSTVTTLTSIASIVGSTVDNARLHARIEYLATRDGLTGLTNRRMFDELLADDVRRAQRDGVPFSLVVLDVDHFKKVNDVHGHQAGDEVLRRVAHELAGAVRASDVVARYGGEEFVALLRGCDVDDALIVADALRRAAVLRDGPVPVTVSAGVASFPAQATDGSTLVDAADAALYEAKRGGRDQARQAAGRRLALVTSKTA